MSALYILSIITGFVILIRLALPWIAVIVANKKLQKTEGMRGRVRSIGLNLIGGVYTIHDVTFSKLDPQSGIETLVVSISKIRIKMSLLRILRKDFTGSIVLTEPNIRYATVLADVKVKPKKEKNSETNEPPRLSPLKPMLQKLPKLQLDMSIEDGMVRYINHTAEPRIDVTISKMQMAIENLSNNSLTATNINLSAAVYGGLFSVVLILRPMEDHLTFHLKMELQEADMVQLNDFFRAYANIDVNSGKFGVSTEMVAKDGAFKGYLTPALKDIDIVGGEDSGDSIFKKIWEGLVAAVFQLLENNKTDEVTTKIPFEGRLDNPHINVVAAITGILKNAFVRAIKPSFENSFRVPGLFRNALTGTERFVKNLFR